MFFSTLFPFCTNRSLFFAEIITVVSSAKDRLLLNFKQFGKSLTYMTNSRGPRIKLGGTEKEIVLILETCELYQLVDFSKLSSF